MNHLAHRRPGYPMSGCVPADQHSGNKPHENRRSPSSTNNDQRSVAHGLSGYSGGKIVRSLDRDRDCHRRNLERGNWGGGSRRRQHRRIIRILKRNGHRPWTGPVRYTGLGGRLGIQQRRIVASLNGYCYRRVPDHGRRQMPSRPMISRRGAHPNSRRRREC
jgi:hypothetical protein